MTINVANVDITTDTFGTAISKINTLATLMTTNVVTADSTATGSITTGNTTLVGILAANTLVATNGLRGGNTSSSNNLLVTSNLDVGANINISMTRVNVGNSTVNTFITSTAIETDGTLTALGATALSNTLNLTGSAVFANTLSVTGLTSLNGAVNTTTANASAINVGANVNLSTTRINVGNSTVNTFITSTAIETDGTLTVLGATSLSNTLTVTGLTSLNGGINTTTANTTQINTTNLVSSNQITANVLVANLFNVGSNVSITTSQLNVGNSTVNTAITSSSINTTGSLTVSGVTTTNTLNTTGLATLNGGVNVTTANASTINVGANVNLSTSRINVGNSTVNTFITSTAIETDGTLTVLGVTSLANTLILTGAADFSNTITSGGLANLESLRIRNNANVDGNITINGTLNLPSGTITITGNVAGDLKPSANNFYEIGNTSVIWRTLNVSNVNAVTSINVGANVNLSTSRINVGNSTVNTFITSTAIETDGTLTALGATALANTLAVAGLTSLNGGINTTTANASTVNVGANVNLTTNQIRVGNTTANVVISNNSININGATIDNTSYSGRAATATALDTSRNFSITGTDLTASAVAFSGIADVALAASLTNTGVAAGTFTKVTVDTKGRITAGANINSSDVTTALGFTPVNSTTGTITSSLTVGNTTVNTSINSISFSTGNSTVRSTINSTAFSGTANNATNLNGQPDTFYTNIPARLGYTPVSSTDGIITNTLTVGNTTVNTSINSVSFSTGNSTVRSTINSTAFSGTANNSNNLNGQAASFYTDIPSRLGYTPVNKSGDTMTGTLNVPYLSVSAQGGADGGEISLARPTTGTTLAAQVLLDINTNSLRIYEGGGAFRGVILDITGCASQSALLHSNNFNSYSPTLVGTGASGTWGISISGLAAKASTLAAGGGNGPAMAFSYSGQSGTPTYVWGSNTGDGSNNLVWSPSNFSVNNAVNLNGQAASFYTDIPSRLGYVPVNRAGDSGMSGNYTTSGAEINIGSGQNEQKRLRFQNANRNVFFYLDTTTFGLWDANGSFNRWVTDASGNFTAQGNITAYSDIKLKINIRPIDNALETVSKLQGVKYQRKSDNTEQIGLVAQQVKEVLPEVVLEDPDGTLSVAYGNIVGLLVEALKEMKNRVDILEERLYKLEN